MPIPTKARPMPPHQPLRLNDIDDVQNRRKPSIQVDKKPAVVVRQRDSARHFTPQNHQLMSECHVPCFEPALRLELRTYERKEIIAPA